MWNSLYVLLEYAKYGDLYQDIKRRKQTNQFYTERELLFMFSQLLDGLHYIHSKGIIHRDIKSLNVFIYSKDPEGYFLKIGDFGVSRLVYIYIYNLLLLD